MASKSAPRLLLTGLALGLAFDLLFNGPQVGISLPIFAVLLLAGLGLALRWEAATVTKANILAARRTALLCDVGLRAGERLPHLPQYLRRAASDHVDGRLSDPATAGAGRRDRVVHGADPGVLSIVGLGRQDCGGRRPQLAHDPDAFPRAGGPGDPWAAAGFACRAGLRRAARFGRSGLRRSHRAYLPTRLPGRSLAVGRAWPGGSLDRLSGGRRVGLRDA